MYEILTKWTRKNIELKWHLMILLRKIFLTYQPVVSIGPQTESPILSGKIRSEFGQKIKKSGKVGRSENIGENAY